MNMKHRRPLARLSLFGVTFVQRKNPFMIAWWSASFPGFGEYIINRYLWATFLTLTEKAINTLGHINEAIIFTFCGKFDSAKSILDPRWALGYMIIYLYAVWDSYRSTTVQNKICHLAELENERIDCMAIHPMGVQYIDPKNPLIAVTWSLFFPGLGQLYNQRFGLAFYAIFWSWIYISLGHVHESLIYVILGNIPKSIEVLNPHWMLFLPSIFGGAAYHAYITAIEHNRIFRIEQRQFLVERYRNSKIRISA